METIKKNAIEIILSFIILSIFTSKGIFNLFFIILVITCFYNYFRTRLFKIDKNFMWFLGLLPLGMILNFQNGGIGGVMTFFSSEKSLFYIPIFMMLNLEIKQFEKIKNYILFGGIFSGMYSFISCFTPNFLGITTLYVEYKRTHKMSSFQNGIRWARLLQILVPVSFFYLEWCKKKIYKLVFVALSVFFIWNIVINGQRAAMLGAIISLISFFLMYVFSLKKDRLVYIITIVVLTISLGISISHNNKMIKERVTSIFDFDDNISNKVRIGYWKIGLDILKKNNYIGVGSGNTGEEFEKFIKTKSKGYQKKYFKYHEGTPFENNYINLAVENGMIYLIYYLIVQVIIFYKIFKRYLEVEDRDVKIKLITIFSLLLGDRVFIFFYAGTDSYVEFLITFLMFYGIKLSSIKERNK